MNCAAMAGEVLAGLRITALPVTKAALVIPTIIAQGKFQGGMTAPTPRVDSVVNSARYGSGPISAGEIVTIFGSALGPTPIVTMQTTADGQSITTTLAGTRVLFDGVAAPMVYTLAGQVSAVAPYAISGQTSTRVQVEHQGVLG